MQMDLANVQKHLEWLKHLLFLDWKANNSKPRTPKRGQVFNCHLGIGIGSELQKTRPCIVVQNDIGNFKSNTVTIVPITHTYKKLSSFIPISNQLDASGKVVLDGFVNVAYIQTIDKARLQDYITDLPTNEMKQIDVAIAKNLDIYKHYKALENKYNDKLKYIQKLQEKIAKLQNQTEKN